MYLLPSIFNTIADFHKCFQAYNNFEIHIKKSDH